jgi:hypothetical protein
LVLREWKKQNHGVSYIMISFVGRTNKEDEMGGRVSLMGEMRDAATLHSFSRKTRRKETT